MKNIQHESRKNTHKEEASLFGQRNKFQLNLERAQQVKLSNSSESLAYARILYYITQECIRDKKKVIISPI